MLAPQKRGIFNYRAVLASLMLIILMLRLYEGSHLLAAAAVASVVYHYPNFPQPPSKCCLQNTPWGPENSCEHTRSLFHSPLFSICL